MTFNPPSHRWKSTNPTIFHYGLSQPRSCYNPLFFIYIHSESFHWPAHLQSSRLQLQPVCHQPHPATTIYYCIVWDRQASERIYIYISVLLFLCPHSPSYARAVNHNPPTTKQQLQLVKVAASVCVSHSVCRLDWLNWLNLRKCWLCKYDESRSRVNFYWNWMWQASSWAYMDIIM